MLDFKDLIQGIDLGKLLENDARMWRATLRVGATVPASSTLPTVLSISNRGVFLSLRMTGRFTTLEAGPADDETCKLSMKINNGSGRVYIPDPIKLDNLLTPGRVKGSVAAGDLGGALNFPGLEWVTVFRPKDDITHTVTNDAAIANSYEIAYHGYWITK